MSRGCAAARAAYQGPPTRFPIATSGAGRSGAELRQRGHARPQLLLAGLCRGRAATAAPQLGMDLRVRPAAAGRVRRYQAGQLLAQGRHPLVRRNLRFRRVRSTPARALGLLRLPLPEQGGDLIRLEQARQAEEVLLVLAPGFGIRAELSAVVEHAVERRRG